LKVLGHLVICLVKFNRIALDGMRYALEVTPFNLAGLQRVLMLVTRLELIGTIINDVMIFWCLTRINPEYLVNCDRGKSTL